MGEFPWITLSIAFLQLTVTAASFAVQAGNGLEMPCGHVVNGGHTCDGVSWIFFANKQSMELVSHGRINSELISDRMEVTDVCSLLIKHVVMEDAGLYTCQTVRYNYQRRDTVVHLSVVSLAQQQDMDGVMFTCSVWRYDKCEHDVVWLVNGKRAGENIPRRNLKRMDGICITDVKVRPDRNSLNYDSWQCKVTDIYNNVYLFTFKSTDRDNSEPTVESEVVEMTTPASEAIKNTTNRVWIHLIIGFVGLTALSITAAVFPRWMTRKRNNPQISQSGVAVTYRAAASTSSASVSINPDDFYENADYINP